MSVRGREALSNVGLLLPWPSGTFSELVQKCHFDTAGHHAANKSTHTCRQTHWSQIKHSWLVQTPNDWVGFRINMFHSVPLPAVIVFMHFSVSWFWFVTFGEAQGPRLETFVYTQKGSRWLRWCSLTVLTPPVSVYLRQLNTWDKRGDSSRELSVCRRGKRCTLTLLATGATHAESACINNTERIQEVCDISRAAGRDLNIQCDPNPSNPIGDQASLMMKGAVCFQCAHSVIVNRLQTHFHTRRLKTFQWDTSTILFTCKYPSCFNDPSIKAVTDTLPTFICTS